MSRVCQVDTTVIVKTKSQSHLKVEWVVVIVTRIGIAEIPMHILLQPHGNQSIQAYIVEVKNKSSGHKKAIYPTIN